MLKRPSLFASLLFISFSICALTCIRTGDDFSNIKKRSSADQSFIQSSLSKIPVSFEENRGQVADEIFFISRGSGYDALFAADRIYFTPKSGAEKGQKSRPPMSLVFQNREGGSAPTGIDTIEQKSNYFIGDDPSQWRTGLNNFSRIEYQELYPGVDLKFYGNQRKLEYDFIIAPGARTDRIKFGFDGADSVTISDDGNLAVSAGPEKVIIRSPFAYQQIDGNRRMIDCNFQVDDAGKVSFSVGSYDRDQELIIDPVLEFSTFFGGSGTDISYGVAVDTAGNIYIAGATSSVNFPLKNPLYNSINGASDAFIMKLNPSISTILFSTFIGGRNSGDRCWAISVDDHGFIYVAGETSSLNFPLVNPIQANFRGTVDGFIAKFTGDGGTMVFSTYHGGFYFDCIYGLKTDSSGNIYVTGRTEAPNFTVKNAIQTTLRGQRDAFITKINADGDIVFSTYLGGNPTTNGVRDEETGYGIALDSNLNIYVTGATDSTSFPTLNAVQPTLSGVEDAFVTKISADGSQIVYSTYFGGTRADNARDIAVDSFGNAYITGYTVSRDYPQLHPIGNQTTGNVDAFLTKFSASGKKVIYSTLLGGSDAENNGLVSENIPTGSIRVDNLGYVYLTGKTDSRDFPTVLPLQSQLSGDQDAFVVKVDPAGSSLIFSTYLGSSYIGLSGFEDRGLAISIDGNGKIYVTGQVLKNDFPLVFPAQGAFGGGLSDVFVSRISTPDINTIAPVSAASFFGAALSSESIVAAFGTGLATGIQAGEEVPLPTVLLGTKVRVRDSVGTERLAPLFFVSPSQVNFLMPAGMANGGATVSITNADNFTASSIVYIDDTAPGLFSANANGQGLAAAFAFRIKADGTQTYEPIVQIDNFGRLVAIPINLGPESDKVFLLLFGTGIRNRRSLESVKIRIGDVDASVAYAGPQSFYVGQDQINVEIPRSLAGRGLVTVSMTVDEMIANSVQVVIR
ncbi:MAG: SBBP repeat-containing protein [Acidobacteria bacterium]|nr:SBBP repeat-containing protein [Acidobacteriota bacterium]